MTKTMLHTFTSGRQITRRDFVVTAGAIATGVGLSSEVSAQQATEPLQSLAGEIGITTGGLNYQREQKILTLATLPNFVRDELGMSLIDLNTRWLTSFDLSYVSEMREKAREADCYFSNLKVNHNIGDLYNRDVQASRLAMEQAKHQIHVAKTLGARWIRFNLAAAARGRKTNLSAHQELARYAGQHELQLVIENGGGMKSDPDSIVNLVKVIGHGSAPAPDTGNWDDVVRYEGLTRSFPGAVTCDFKVFELDAQGRHEKYDIRRCFEIGWKAGFRGPWAIEHWNENTDQFVRETVLLRDRLKQWME